MHSGYVDVLIMTALPEELAAVLALGDGGEAGWKRTKDQSGATYHVREFVNARGKPFVVAAAWSGGDGQAGVAQRAKELIEILNPSYVATCGSCVGVPGKVALGDVIVANRVYSYANWGRTFRAHELGSAWRIDAPFITRALELSSELRASRPRSIESQEQWLLHALYSAETNGSPLTHPERRQKCPDWARVINRLRLDGHINTAPGSLSLTDKGLERVAEERLLYPDGLPEDPESRILVGPLVTVDSLPWNEADTKEIRKYTADCIGVDSEAATLVDLPHVQDRRAIVVKSVTRLPGAPIQPDYHLFALRASAECLLEILQRLFSPEERPVQLAPTSRRDIFLEHIAIYDFKNIHRLDIDFATASDLPGHWTCIAGLNGAGKSAVLQAIALVLLGDRLATELGGSWLARARRITDNEQSSADIRARVRMGQEVVELSLPLDENGINQPHLQADERSYQRMREFWAARARGHLLLAYGAGRNLSEYRDTRHRDKTADVRRQMTLFDPLTQVASVDVLLDQGERAKPVLTMLKRLLDIVLEDVALSVEESDAGLQFRCGDAIVPASELPDGFRATIAWLADICAAWHEKAPEEAKDGDPSKIRAIVLIDEIDLHLHASLQRVLVPRLRKALPEVQWIVTTHSPLVISSFDRREIVLLQPGPKGPERHELDRQILGFSTDEVYEYLMEIPPRSAALESEVEGTGGARLAEILAQSPKVNEEQARQDRAWMDDLARHLRESQTKGEPEDGSP